MGAVITTGAPQLTFITTAAGMKLDFAAFIVPVIEVLHQLGCLPSIPPQRYRHKRACFRAMPSIVLKTA